MRGETPARAGSDELRKLIFRNMMIDGRDLDIGDVIYNYFTAIKRRWPDAWGNAQKGNMLAKTNGFRAFMRLLRHAYLEISEPGGIPSEDEFGNIVKKIKMQDDDFNVDNFKPGSSGESDLYRQLRDFVGSEPGEPE